jgi:FkbM family methyltransferase
MDRKWSFAAKHSWRSAAGFLRLFPNDPSFARQLFARRWSYFSSRQIGPPLITPDNFIIDTPDTLIAYWSIFVERELHDDRWVKALRGEEKPLAVDVGANAGVFSHYVFSLRPDAEVIAFEPLPAMAKRIRDLQKRTGVNLTCYEKAVSRESGFALFESPHGHEGISRFATPSSSGNTFRVETTTLDLALAGRHVSVMKIDVEGFELDVIAGGKSVLAKTDFVIVESEESGHLRQITEVLGPDWARSRLAATDYLFARRVPQSVP